MQAHIKFIRTLRAICHTISPQVCQQSISKKTRKRLENDTKKEAAQKRERPRAPTAVRVRSAVRCTQRRPGTQVLACRFIGASPPAEKKYTANHLRTKHLHPLYPLYHLSPLTKTRIYAAFCKIFMKYCPFICIYKK